MATGVVWSIAGAGIANAFAMLANVACARLLGATNFGELAIVMSTINLFTTVSSGGLGMTATKYIAEYRSTDPERAGTVVGLSWVMAVLVSVTVACLLLVLSPWLSQNVFHAPRLGGALALSAAILFFGALNGAQVGTLSGLEAFHLIALGNFIRGTCIAVFVTLGAALKGLEGVLGAYIIVGAAVTAFYQVAARRECAAKAIPISYRFRREDLRILWLFTLPVLLSAFSFPPAAWWSNVLLANRSGYAEAGVFNAAFQWQMAILFLSNAVSNIGLPMLSNVWADRDSAKYKRCLAINFVLTAGPAFGIAVPLAIGATRIMRMYGTAFEHGATALVLLSAAAVLSAMNITIGHVIWSLEATMAGALLAFLRGGTLVLATYALAGNGAIGLAAAYLIMGAIQSAVQIPFMIRLVRRKFAPSSAALEAALA